MQTEITSDDGVDVKEEEEEEEEEDEDVVVPKVLKISR